MSQTDAFATIRRARSLLGRHPDAPPSVAHVALVMATFANGRTGTSIRPGYGRVAELTGLHPQTVKRAVKWLVAHQELRRDKAAHPGSTACFTWVGGMEVPETPPIMGVPEVADGGASRTTHQPNQPSPSSPPGSQAGERWGCSMCEARVPLDDGLCRACFEGWYGDERTFAA